MKTKLAIMTLLFTLSSQAAIARRIVVNPTGGGDAQTIAAGLSLVANGDTLLISSGLYYEHSLLVKNDIVVQGALSHWPIIDGSASSVIFSLQWPHNATFRNLVLRNAGTGIISRKEGDICTGPASVWAADSLVLYQLTEAGIDADNYSCAVGAATWTNLLALDCAVGFQVNDFGTVTGSRLVALRCQTAVGLTHGSASFDCFVAWQNGVLKGGLDKNQITINRLIEEDPKLFFYIGKNDPTAWLCVDPGSPCMPANNACSAVIGVVGAGPCPLTVGVSDPVFAASMLRQNVPNPFNPSTTISIQVPRLGAFVTVEIYDASGRIVTSLAHEFMAQGEHRLTWDGRNAQGKQLASGVYFCRLRAGQRTEAMKMVLLK